VANFCFLTKDTNLQISDRLPEKYFPEVEADHPGALASQWIPTDPELWRIENYDRFLEARRKLLADETNRRMEDLLHGNTGWLGEGTARIEHQPVEPPVQGVADADEEARIHTLNPRVERYGLPRGQAAFDYRNPDTGGQLAVFDLAWPDGIQEELSPPVAVIFDESRETLAIANEAGYRCFTREESFRDYILNEVRPIGAEVEEDPNSTYS